MNVLYIAPRYHTNQIPVIKGWLENGHRVMFISQFAADGEDYSDITPVTLGYSPAFEFMMKLWKGAFRLLKGREASEKEEFDLRIKAGFPSKQKLSALLKDFNPDLCILRERSLYNVSAARWCKKNKVICIFYYQSPLYGHTKKSDGPAKKIIKSLLPKTRITPVTGILKGAANLTGIPGQMPKGAAKLSDIPGQMPKGAANLTTPATGSISSQDEFWVQEPDSFFVPFAAQYQPPRQRPYPDIPVILCIARYEERKQLFMLVEVLGRLRRELGEQHRFCITIAGEAVSPSQTAYYEKLCNAASKEGLWDISRFLKNLSRNEVFELYKSSDIFVLPSTKERASIAQLEAMSFSLPVICSNTNGSACYVENEVNGFHFKDMNPEDLYDKLKRLVEDSGMCTRMGRESYRLVNENYLFKNYYEALMEASKIQLPVPDYTH